MSAARTRADLFREYARVIEMCEGTGVRPDQCVRRYSACSDAPNDLVMYSPDVFTFAIAIVEDRPVFEGDELWHNVCGKVRVLRSGGPCRSGDMYCAPDNVRCFSWNPPKPKTVMVELQRGDAENIVRIVESMHITIGGVTIDRLAEACRKALDK